MTFNMQAKELPASRTRAHKYNAAKLRTCNHKGSTAKQRMAQAVSHRFGKHVRRADVREALEPRLRNGQQPFLRNRRRRRQAAAQRSRVLPVRVVGEAQDLKRRSVVQQLLQNG